MAKFSADRLIKYKEWKFSKDIEHEWMGNVFNLFLEGIGENTEANNARGQRIIIPNKVLEAIYWAAFEGYSLCNLQQHNGKYPLEMAYGVFLEEERKAKDKKDNFILPISKIVMQLFDLDEAYKKFPGAKKDFIAGVKDQYEKLLNVGDFDDDLTKKDSNNGSLNLPLVLTGAYSASEVVRRFPIGTTPSYSSLESDVRFFARIRKQIEDQERMKNGELVKTEIDPAALEQVRKEWADIAEQRKERMEDPKRGKDEEGPKGLE